MSHRPDDFGARLVAFLPNMRRFAYSLARSRDGADDLVQAACERALAARSRFEEGTRFESWVLRIVRNLWIDRLRRDRTAGPTEDLSERDDLVGIGGEADVEARLMLTSVAEAILLLPDEQREVLMLTCVEDLAYKDAAEVLGVPIGTVMSRLSRARRRLAELAGINAEPDRSPVRKGSSL